MPIEGVLVVDKPAGITSMRVVERVRRVLRQRRAGHTGTLDPAATGVLPVCLGEATKIARYLTGSDKEYLATIRLGVETDSGDQDGQVLTRRDTSKVQPDDVDRVLQSFRGKIRQRPPALSAIRVDGERLHRRVRRGEEVTVPERDVTIHELEVLAVRLPDVDIRMLCSKGTYVRSLAVDVGEQLGVGGSLVALRRSRAGSLALDQAVLLDDLDRFSSAEAEGVVISPAHALVHLPQVRANDEGLRRLRDGQKLMAEHLDHADPESWSGTSPVCVVDNGGRLAAVAEGQGDVLQPRRVFPVPL